MIDIIVFALPVDRERAGVIVDALVDPKVAGVSRTRFVTAHPGDGDWRAAVSAVEACPCVIFCWSRASAAPGAALVVELAQRVLMAGHAISVELDAGARPAAMAASTTYPLHGWRARPGGWRRFLYGRGYVTQIVAAAQQKLLGNDPPPPRAFWRLARAQVRYSFGSLLVALGIGASILQFYRDPSVAQKLDRDGAAAFARAKESADPCKALGQFQIDYQGSAFSDDATALLAACHDKLVEVSETVETALPIFAPSNEAMSREADKVCTGLAETARAKLLSFEIVNLAGDSASGFTATARCTLDQPRSDTRRVLGDGPQPAPQPSAK